MNNRMLTLAVIWYTFFTGIAFGQWEEINTPQVGGSIDALVKSGINLFAIKGFTINSVYLSTDNGTSWKAANDGLANKYVQVLTVNGNALFAGTDKGVYLSTDNGSSWNGAGLADKSVWVLAVSGSNLFAGTDTSGVYLSTDNGVSWKAVNDGLTDKNVRALAARESVLFAGTGDGVFLSTDNGGSWNGAGLTDQSVSALAQSGSNLFAGTDTNGVYLSTDNGTSWKQINSGLPSKSVVVLTLSKSYLFAGLKAGVFLSTDSGASWNETGLNRWVTALAASGTDLFAGTRKGGGGPDVAAQMHRLPLSSVPVTHQPECFKVHAQPAVRINVQQSAIKMFYRIKASCYVQFDLYTMSGKRVASLARGMRSAGEYCAAVNKNVLPAGLFICRFKAGFYKEDNSVLIIR